MLQSMAAAQRTTATERKGFSRVKLRIRRKRLLLLPNRPGRGTGRQTAAASRPSKVKIFLPLFKALHLETAFCQGCEKTVSPNLFFFKIESNQKYNTMALQYFLFLPTLDNFGRFCTPLQQSQWMCIPSLGLALGFLTFFFAAAAGRRLRRDLRLMGSKQSRKMRSSCAQTAIKVTETKISCVIMRSFLTNYT